MSPQSQVYVSINPPSDETKAALARGVRAAIQQSRRARPSLESAYAEVDRVEREAANAGDKEHTMAIQDKVVGVRLDKDGISVIYADGAAIPLGQALAARAKHDAPRSDAPPLNTAGSVPNVQIAEQAIAGMAEMVRELNELRAFKASVPWAAWADALRIVRLATVASGTGMGLLEILERWLELHKPHARD